MRPPSFEPEVRDLLAQARIGMLAIHSRHAPLVNPAAFYFGAGSLWMTTSRYAAKLPMARRDPRAAFAVAGGKRSLVIQGTLETFDPRSVSGQLRAALSGPGFYLSLGGYALKNAGFVGGYLLDLARIPGEWWPQNRAVLRLRVERWRLLEAQRPPAAAARRLPGVPGEVSRALARSPTGYLCWNTGGRLTLAPALWTQEGDHVVAMPASDHWPGRDGMGAFVVESHHRYRATRMLGACLRGALVGTGRQGVQAVAERYQLSPEEAPASALRVDASRVTWWRGFEVATSRLGGVEQPAIAAAGGGGA